MDFCPLFITINISVCIVFFLLSVILPLLHTLFLAQAQGRLPNMYTIMLKYGLFINIGSVFFGISVSNFVYGAYVAQCLEWQHSLFQYEVAASQLGIALLGFLSLAFNRYFWLATLIVSTIWLWSAALIHCSFQIVQSTLSYHMAVIIGWEFIVPLYLLTLYVLHTRSKSSYKFETI